MKGTQVYAVKESHSIKTTVDLHVMPSLLEQRCCTVHVKSCGWKIFVICTLTMKMTKIGTPQICDPLSENRPSGVVLQFSLRV